MSFQVALTGLDAATSNLEVISNNIANSNTNGFKRSRAEFADVYASSDFGAVANATGKGVRVTNIRQQHTQGDINYTNNNLDIAISGGGLFRLKDNGGGIVYSRAGAFGLDREGYVSNATEQRLTGYQVDDKGNILPTMGELKIDRADLQPRASEKIDLTANLDQTSKAIGATAAFDVSNPKSYNFTTGATVFDSQGSTHVINYYFRKESDNNWKMFTVSGDTDTIVGDTNGYNIAFGNDGRIDSLADSAGTQYVARNSDGVPEGSFPVTVDAAALGSSVDNISLTVDLSKITQFDSASGVNSVIADGFSSGRLSSLDIDKSGVVFGRYSNGQSKAMGQIALANFSSLDGLRPVGDSAWAESFASGPPAIGAPGSASLGYIQSSALESSNVNVTEELVDMIGAQRSFQANAQIISVTDSLTQTVINMRR